MKTYSHPATKQDLWVLEHRGSGGTFCELGAYDGITHSNTRLLEEHDWKGVLIEAHEPFYQRCKENRPNALCHHAAVGDGRPKSLIVGGQYTGLAETMPPTWLVEHRRRGNRVYEVDTYPLISFANEVDYLSLDTEGGEYEILEAWLESGGCAQFITVEFRYDTELLHRLERLGSDHGYILDEVRGFDLCLIKQ